MSDDSASAPRPPGVRANKRATLRGLFAKTHATALHDAALAITESQTAPSVSANSLSKVLVPGVSEQVIDELAEGVITCEFSCGDVVLREGEPGDSCYLIELGRARVFKRDPQQPHGDFIEVAELGPGDLFGEIALLGDRRRHATVVAGEELRLLEIKRSLFLRLCNSYREFKDIFEAAYRHRLIENLLATAPFLTVLSSVQRSALLRRFTLSRVASGTVLIKQGASAGGFYLIVLGGVEISKRLPDQDDGVLIATLGEGDYFGELSLLRGDLARATVLATGPTELLVLSPGDFYELMSKHPVLWSEVHEHAHLRELQIHSLLAGQGRLS